MEIATHRASIADERVEESTYGKTPLDVWKMQVAEAHPILDSTFGECLMSCWYPRDPILDDYMEVKLYVTIYGKCDSH